MTYSITRAVKDFESRAENAGVTINQLCSEAGVLDDLFDKWKSGDSNALITSLEKINSVLTNYETNQQKEKQA